MEELFRIFSFNALSLSTLCSAKNYNKQGKDTEGQGDEYFAYKLSFTHVLVTNMYFRK